MLARNMRILMENHSLKAVAAMILGNRVLTYAGTGTYVQNVRYSSKHRCMLQITTEDTNLLMCTPDLVVFTPDGPRKAGDIKTGMKMERLKQVYVEVLEVQWIRNRWKMWNLVLPESDNPEEKMVYANGYRIDTRY